MSQRLTLLEMIRNLRAETGRSLTTSVGVQERDTLVHNLQRTQKWLWYDYNWPRQVIDRDITLEAGSRYYAYPTDMDFEFVQTMWAQIGIMWTPLDIGITPMNYTMINSEAGIQSWPPRRWMHRVDQGPTNGDGQFELWPVPDQAGTLRIRGRRKLLPLVADTDYSTLDCDLIVLFAAARMLARMKAEDAQIVAAEAQRLYMDIKGRQSPDRGRTVVIGGGNDAYVPPAGRPGIDYIPMGYGKGGT